jgi:exopolyphosphatase/guanosine-5'-triphosphate,3'-diphosphate pyrophosphatase
MYPSPERVRRACIDIGSNTIRLLVADRTDGGLTEVMQLRAFTRLGHGMDSSGRIAADKLAESAAEVAVQARAARELGVDAIRVVATAAVRRAANGSELCRAVQEASGLAVDVLTGEEEARLAFLGATSSLRGASGPLGVVDVGGGSTELVVGTLEGGASWCASLPLGSGDLSEAHLAGDPPRAAEVAALREHVAGAFAALDPPPAGHALAVGGSATSLYRLLGPVLDEAALSRGLLLLQAHTVVEVARRWDLDEQRVRLLPAGIVLLEAAGRVLGCPLRVAGGGLREGVLLETS